MTGTGRLFYFLSAPLLLLANLTFGQPVQSKAQPQILVVQSYSSDYAWDALWIKGLESVLREKANLTYFEMNTKKLPPEDHPGQAAKAFQEFGRVQPDLVILADDTALKLVGPLLAEKPVPVVYIGINNNPRNYFPTIPSNFTGILERPLLRRSLVYLKDILPKATRALILFDTDITSQVIKSEIFYDREELDVMGITATIRLVGSLKEWQETVRTSQGNYDFIILGLYQTLRDDSGANVNPEVLARWTGRNSPVPLFGFWNFTVSRETAVGGLVLYGEDMGVRAGQLVSKILEGQDIRKTPPEVNNQGVLLFSRSQLTRWNITLPEAILKEARFVD